MKVYLSGPMTGLPNSNYPAFNLAAKEIRSLGVEVENPAETSLPATSSWPGFMRDGIARMMTCDAIVLLEGWPDSRGANIEFNLAKDLGMPQYTKDAFLEKARTALQGAATAAANLQRDDARSTENSELGAALQRVRELHKPVDVEPSERVCQECHRAPDGKTYLIPNDYPCNTIRALDGAE